MMHQRWWRLVCSVVVCLFMAPALVASPAAAAQDGALSLSQVSQLIDVAPDAAIADEIRNRRLAFRLDEATLKSLVAKGAGPLTSAELSEFLPRGQVTIASKPDADVFVDGAIAGQTDAGGRFTTRVRTGNHTIRLTRPQHHDASATISVEEGQERSLQLPLEWSVGFVMLSANRPAATITIEGVGRFSSQAHAQATPGRYAVTVTGPNLQTLQRQITIIGGETTTERFDVPIDPAFRATALAEAQRALQAKAWYEASERAKSIVAVDPGDGEALIIQANVHLGQSQFQEFESQARTGLAHGGAISYLVMHHHTLRDMVHPARLSFTRSTLTFEPQGSCTTKPFTVPLSTIKDAGMTSTDANEAMWELVVLEKPGSKKTVSLKFGELESRWVQINSSKSLLGGSLTLSGTKNVLQSSSEGIRSLVSISRVLKDAMAGRLPTAGQP